MLENGRSWSGHERNLAYLNTRDGRFSDVSALAGFAFPSDSRALGLVDWEGDGDLDVWQANRSAPRVRMLLNQLPLGNHFLRLRLIGTDCNRDAIGARAVVALEDGRRLTRTLRAGEGYLSQSSKTLHFGLPKDVGIRSVSIRWPGRGAPEEFTDLQAGGTYHLTQGLGEARRDARAPVALHSPPAPPSVREAPSGPDSSGIRLVPHARVPLPQLPYQTLPDQTPADAATLSKPTLVVLWASWCQPCLHEIKDLSAESAAFAQAGLEVLLINVEESPRRVSGVGEPFRQGAAAPAFLEAFDAMQRILTGRERDASLPASFLTDSQGRLLALYKGPLAPSTVLQDLALAEIPDETFRDRAVPYPGRWVISSMPSDLLAIPQALLDAGQARLAFDYLETHITGQRPPRIAADFPSISLSMEGVGEAYAAAASGFLEAGDRESGKHAYLRALHYQPERWPYRTAFAVLCEDLGDFHLAVAQWREALKLQPGHPGASHGLAWLLATAPDPEVRDPEEALTLARQACEATRFTVPHPLDSLAAAQAAAGQFAEAAENARKALALAEQLSGSDALAQAIRGRLALYENNQPYVRPAGSSPAGP